MIKKLFFLLLSAFIILSCNTEESKPDDLLDKEDMIQIIKDLMLLEATYNTQLVRVKDKTERMRKYSKEVFDYHNITQEEFDASYEYYIKRPEEFEAMLELVFEELNKMETEAAKYNQMKKDSVSTLVSP